MRSDFSSECERLLHYSEEEWFLIIAQLWDLSSWFTNCEHTRKQTELYGDIFGKNEKRNKIKNSQHCS